MKKIIVNSKRHGVKEVLVDDNDFNELIKYKWYVVISSDKNTFYAKRYNGRKPDGSPKAAIRMHRQLLGLLDSNIQGDHIDHNGLNNQMINLRHATPKQNGRNKTSHRGSASKYLGVKIRNRKVGNKSYKDYYAVIVVDGKRMPIKHFKFTPEGEVQAAKAYDEMAKKYFGEFANLNFK